MADLFSDIGNAVGTLAAPEAGVLAGGINLLGGLLQQGSSAGQVQQQEGFQKGMADTQYQRTVADLRAAGLNPMLAYMGSPDPSPQGTMFQPQNILGNAAGAGISSAVGAADVGNTAQTTLLNGQLLVNAQQQFQNLSDTDKGILISNDLANLEKQLTTSALPAQQIVNDWWASHPKSAVVADFVHKLLAPASAAAAGAAGAALAGKKLMGSGAGPGAGQSLSSGGSDLWNH